MPHRALLAGVSLGRGVPVAVMGALNVSPESFHAGSIHTGSDDLLAAALAMVDAGAALIDLGARSTAPYGSSSVSAEDERERLARAVDVLAAKVPVPISADTARPGPARAALDAGARVINDISGLRDPEVAALIRERRAGAILMAFPHEAPSRLSPVASVKTLLQESLERARGAGIPDEQVVLDPGIGFFRGERVAWDEWDTAVLAGLAELEALGRPLCVGVSRKSFLGAIIGRPMTEDRLAGSLAATAVAVWNGASLIRTHDVAETLDAVRIAERIRRAGGTL
ncbi:MAG: dihydropteroate synthase [Candidatus Rokuibacteriota bacterium]|nr:MAG: dihydropteroate synthase [Candidatus Rokubacteria bacterium]